jgi:lipoprotein signal peptidase
LLAAVAAALLVPDLAQKALSPVYGHPRSTAYALLAAALLALVVALVPRVPSRAVAVAGGVAAAGAAGNLVSSLAWRGGVPNPIVAGDVAFNLADVYALVGAAALVTGAAAFALRHPERLREPI